MRGRSPCTNTRLGPPGGELGAHRGRRAPGMGVPPPSSVGARAGCRSGAQAGSSEGLQKWVLLLPCGWVLIHPQAGRWVSGCPFARGTGAMGFLTVFTAISAEEHLCWRLLVGEVFKLLEEEGVSLSELEPAPLDSL